MKERINIIFTEDQDLVREALIPKLEAENIYTIAEAQDGIQLLELLMSKKPDLVLLDIGMKNMDGTQALKIIKTRYPDLKVVILTSYSDGSLKNQFKAKGASAYLTKTTKFEIIAKTIRKVHRSDAYTNLTKKSRSKFTDREVDLIPYILKGKTTKEIAEALGLAEKTVEGHRNRLYAKTMSKNAAEFGSYCGNEGLNYLVGKFQV